MISLLLLLLGRFFFTLKGGTRLSEYPSYALTMGEMS